VLPARLVREIPSASRDLPSAALGTEGGGDLALDPSAGPTQAFERLFHFELAMEAPDHFVGFGQRIHVRFDHGAVPLARQWYRAMRQLFLSRFDV
jgi:putative peptide zinc metalloprotease protein